MSKIKWKMHSDGSGDGSAKTSHGRYYRSPSQHFPENERLVGVHYQPPGENMHWLGSLEDAEKHNAKKLQGESTVAECIDLLQLALLGEDWYESHRSRVAAADDQGRAHDVDLAQHHSDQADFHKAKVEKHAAAHTTTEMGNVRHLKVHRWKGPNSKRKGLRHLALFRAHERAAANYNEPDPRDYRRPNTGSQYSYKGDD